MSCKFNSSAALAAIASLASGALFAQAPPTVVIAFNGSSSVPLDAWTSVGAALAIAAAAYALFRHRRAGSFGRLSAWLVVATVAAGATLMAWRVDFIAAAHAVAGPTQVTLTTSPASIVVGNGNALLEVSNGTNAPLRIDSVRLQNPAQGQGIVQFEGTNCVPGLTLQVRGICYVAVGLSNPG